MVEKMDMQKIFSPISPPAKVKKVKQQHPDMQQKRFASQLQQETEKKKKGKQNRNLPEVTKIEEEGKRKKVFEKDDRESHNTEVKQEKEASQGKLIDIVV
jgi:ribosomal protein L14E/L6E/L27E